jgi:hypothetical protein
MGPPKKSVEERLENIAARLESIENLLTEVVQRLDSHEITSGAPSEVVVVEQMNRDEVREKVLHFVKTHGTTDIVQLHKEIRCEISLLAEILEELIAEGKIGE